MFYEMRKNHDYLPSPVIYMTKADLIKKNKITFYEGIIHEDNLFTIQLIFKANRVQHINKEFYIRNVRDNSIMTKGVSIANAKGYFVCIEELLKFSETLKLTTKIKKELSDYIIFDLQHNLIGSLEKLPSEEIQTYKSSLKTEDLILFNLLTQDILQYRSTIFTLKKGEKISYKQNNLLPYKNTRFNRYSFKLGSKILYFPRKIYRLMRKLGILKIIKIIYNKTFSLFNNIFDFFYVELNPTYRAFMEFYKNREKYPIDYDTTLVFPKEDISVSQSIQNIRETTNDYTSKIVVCKSKNVNDVNILSCKIDLPAKKKHKYNKKRHLQYFSLTKSHINEIKNIEKQGTSINNFTKIQDPLISIVMPIFNQERYLEEAITDILNQSFKNFELICVDDGSNDKTLEILINLAKNDNRIRIITKSRENAGAARNLGLIFARGKYVIFLDSDDRFDKNLLKEMYNKMNKTNADICVCDANMYNNSTKEIKPGNFLKKERVPSVDPFNKTILKSNLYLFCNPTPWNKIFKTSFLKENNIFFQNLTRTNDLLFVFHSFTKAKKITTLNEKLIHYRIGTKTNLQSRNDETPFTLPKALLKLKDILEEEGLFTGYIEQSFVNVAIANLLYHLNSMKKKENVRIVKYWLKKYGLKDLHIHGHSRDYFLYGHDKILEKYCKIKFSKT
jgi:glycosyltransferase involved in cell wall biosynthesis